MLISYLSNHLMMLLIPFVIWENYIGEKNVVFLGETASQWAAVPFSWLPIFTCSTHTDLFLVWHVTFFWCHCFLNRWSSAWCNTLKPARSCALQMEKKFGISGKNSCSDRWSNFCPIYKITAGLDWGACERIPLEMIISALSPQHFQFAPAVKNISLLQKNHKIWLSKYYILHSFCRFYHEPKVICDLLVLAFCCWTK